MVKINVRHRFCIVTARKNAGAYYISALSCHTASCRAHTVQDQDQNRDHSETGLVVRPWSQTPRLIGGSIETTFSIK